MAKENTIAIISIAAFDQCQLLVPQITGHPE